jgi:polyphosphate kinase
MKLSDTDGTTLVTPRTPTPVPPDSPRIFFNRELSWLNFVERVIELIEDRQLPLLERVKFAGIAGMLHDEFFMKRVSGLKRQVEKNSRKTSLDGLRPEEELASCRRKLLKQIDRLGQVVEEDLRPRLAEAGLTIHNHGDLSAAQKEHLREYFGRSVMPILTPLAVDSEHPFPFISNLGLNLAVIFADNGRKERVVRIKVPNNRPRWTPVPNGAGVTPLEQVIAANLDMMYPTSLPKEIYPFRVTRGAEGDLERIPTLPDDALLEHPGRIIELVSNELKARRFAGVVRLQCDRNMPKKYKSWMARQLRITGVDLYPAQTILLGIRDFMDLPFRGHDHLRFPRHVPITHSRLRLIKRKAPHAVFEEIARGDILLHHPYHDFDTSVLRFIESAAIDPAVLAIKLTIYRTSGDSPIVRALAEAARRDKQVAVLVEVTARFDEAPNIAWGRYLENEGVHVSYGVEQLKTHVKLALVVREEGDRIRRYAHIGTGNYHTGTARLYEDLGVLTADPTICSEIAVIFNALTGATPHTEYHKMLVAPASLRSRLNEMIRREAANAMAGRPSGIDAKMNQLQDPDIIRELYAASQAGVPIRLNVRGLCCLRPGLAGVSENIRVFSIVGRYLEHSRIYRFVNNGAPLHFIGSADWMKRNLNSRVETVVPILDDRLKQELDAILEVYYTDNCSAWDCGSDGVYKRRSPGEGEERRATQETFIRREREEPPASFLSSALKTG